MQQLKLLVEQRELEGALEKRDVAEAALREASEALLAREEKRRKAEDELKTQELALAKLRTSLETDLSSEQRRETKLHAARSERLELETRRRSLRDALERWANVETKAAMLARREATLDEARARVARVAVDLQVNDEATEGLRGEVAKLEALADACELVEVRAELASVNERADAVRAERADLVRLQEETSRLTRCCLSL